MRDVADVSQAFMRNGAIFVAIAVVAATTLAANASSAPLSRAWRDLDDDLLEVGYAINSVIGGVTGSARGPNILFQPNQTIRGLWESSSQLVFTATTTETLAIAGAAPHTTHSMAAPGSSLTMSPSIVAPGADVLAGTAEPVRADGGRHVAVVHVTPADYGGDVIVAPDAPAGVNQPVVVRPTA